MRKLCDTTSEAYRDKDVSDFVNGTDSALSRLLRHVGIDGASAPERGPIRAHPRHEFWPDDVPYTEVPCEGIIGHRQITDAYLAQLARVRGARIATFDRGMAKLYSDVVELIPDS